MASANELLAVGGTVSGNVDTTTLQQNGTQSTLGNFMTVLLFLVTLWFFYKLLRFLLNRTTPLPNTTMTSEIPTNNHALTPFVPYSQNELRKNLNQFKKIKSDIYVTENNLSVAISEFRRAEGKWNLIVDIHNFSDERIRINYKTLRFYYKNGVVDELNIDENGSEIIDSNDGMVSYLKFDTVSKAKPKGLEIVFSDPYGKEVSILTEPNYKDI